MFYEEKRFRRISTDTEIEKTCFANLGVTSKRPIIDYNYNDKQNYVIPKQSYD